MTGTVTVQVDFYAGMQQAFGGSSIRLTFDGRVTVSAVLEKIADSPQRREKIFDPAGAVRRELTLLKNGRNVNFIGGTAAEIESGDVLAVFPPVLGG